MCSGGSLLGLVGLDVVGVVDRLDRVVVVGVGLGLGGVVLTRSATGPEAEAAETGEAGHTERAAGHVVEAAAGPVLAEEGVHERVACRAVLLAGVLVEQVEAQDARHGRDAGAGALALLGGEVPARRPGVAEEPAQLVVGEVRSGLVEPVGRQLAQDAVERVATLVTEPGGQGVGTELQLGRDQLRHVGVLRDGDRERVPQVAVVTGPRSHQGELEAGDLEPLAQDAAPDGGRTEGVDAQADAQRGSEELDERVDRVVDVLGVDVHAVAHADLVVLVLQCADVLLVGGGAPLVVLLGELGAQGVERGLGGLVAVLLGLLQDVGQQHAQALGEVLDGRRLVGDVRGEQHVLGDGRVPEEGQVVDDLVVAGDERLRGRRVPDSLGADELALGVEVAFGLCRSLTFGGAGFTAHG